MALRRKPGRKKAVAAKIQERKPSAPKTWGERLIKWHSLYKPALLAAAVVLVWFGQEQLLARHLNAGLWLWLGGAILAGMAFRKQPDKLPSRLESNRLLEAGLLALILLIGLMVRVWRLSEVPNGYFFDEAVNAFIGQRIIQDSNYLPIFGPPDAPLPTLYHYFIGVAMKLGGISAYATKFVPALLGTATVAMFYFLVRRMVSWPVALAAALLLALMRWHINFSRINFVGIATPMFGAAAAYFLLRGMETRNRWHMALSGLAVSLGLYTYYASNLVPLVLGPYMVLQLAWDRNFLKAQWHGLLVFLAV
ncbi:glycosyltransferase family 39 protein, partial [bacterium]|nr:glycosyltransferase family 39 protein [bacterium]